uniref:Uncharacterized protein n=1 Tax=Panagrolaimus superbus TaxID=310955 RepID=A0A914YXG1_9BILA
MQKSFYEFDAAKELIREGIGKYKGYDEFYMMLGQIYVQEKKIPEARKAFVQTIVEGIHQCRNSIQTWLELIRFENSQGELVKAGLYLDMGNIIKHRHNELLLLESFRLELGAGQKEIAQHILSKALQECEKSGLLWAETIFLEPSHSRQLLLFILS